MYPVQIGHLFLEDKTKADILINESSVIRRFRRESDIRGWKKRKLIGDCGFSENKIINAGSGHALGGSAFGTTYPPERHVGLASLNRHVGLRDLFGKITKQFYL